MDDLTLRNLEAVAEAVPAVLALLWSEGYGDDGRVVGLSDALGFLKGRNISNEYAGQEYDNGPWATGGSDFRPDYPRYESSDWSYTDATGPYHFLAPDVSGKDESKEPICIVPLGEGYLVEYGDDLADQKGFTDCVNVAEWLLGWLGFEDEMVESVRDILAGLWDADELMDREELVRIARSACGIQADKLLDKDNAEEVFSNPLLDIAEAAWAYIEAHGADAQRNEYLKLAKAANKWRMTEDEESPKTDANT